MPPPSPLASALLGLLAVAPACAYRFLERPESPVLGIRTTGGSELGVATDDGIIFLGRSAHEGPAKVTYWIKEAPIVEAGTIRPFGGSLHSIELDVPIPSVPIDFEQIQPGEALIMMGVDGLRRWRVPVRAVQSERIQGSAVTAPTAVKLSPQHVGAGVFREAKGSLRLVGLVKAVAVASSGERWLLLAGPTELRRALLAPRAAVPRLEARYRADGTRTMSERKLKKQ